MYGKTAGWTLVILLTGGTIIDTFAYPNQQMQRGFAPMISRGPELPEESIQRKFAEKPNAIKKVSLDDINNDIETNEIQEPGFTWSNLLGKEKTFVGVVLTFPWGTAV